MERHGLASSELMWPHSNDPGTDESDDTADSDDTSDPDDDDSEMGEAGEERAIKDSGTESDDEDESDSESDIQEARASSAMASESDAEDSDDESELEQPGEDVQMRESGSEHYDSEEGSTSYDSSSEDSDSEDSDSDDADLEDSDIEENTGEDVDMSERVAERVPEGEVKNFESQSRRKRKRPQSKNPEGKEPQKNDLQKQKKNDEAATAELTNHAFDTSDYTNFTATNATVCVESPTGPWYEITSPVRCTCCGQKKGIPGSVVIATDGSCLNMLDVNKAGVKPSPAACSIFFHPESKLNDSWMLPGEVETSQRAEYTGALMALRIALKIRRSNPNLTDEQLLARGNVGPETKLRQVLIKTDNETLVLAMTRKMKRKSGSGKPVRDADLLIAIDNEIEALNTSEVRVGFLWVSRTENTHADALAKKKLKDVGAKALMKKQSQKKKTGRGKGKGEKKSKKEEKEEKKCGGKKRVRTKRGKKTNPTNKTKPEKKGKIATKKPGKSQRKKQKTA